MQVLEIVHRAARKPALWIAMSLALALGAGALSPTGAQNSVVDAAPRRLSNPVEEAFEHKVSMYREGLLMDPERLRSDFGLARLQVALRPIWGGVYSHGELIDEIVEVLSPAYESIQVHPTAQEYKPRHFEPCEWWLQCTSTTTITIGDEGEMPMCIEIETGMMLE